MLSQLTSLLGLGPALKTPDTQKDAHPAFDFANVFADTDADEQAFPPDLTINDPISQGDEPDEDAAVPPAEADSDDIPDPRDTDFENISAVGEADFPEYRVGQDPRSVRRDEVVTATITHSQAHDGDIGYPGNPAERQVAVSASALQAQRESPPQILDGPGSMPIVAAKTSDHVRAGATIPQPINHSAKSTAPKNGGETAILATDKDPGAGISRDGKSEPAQSKMDLPIFRFQNGLLQGRLGSGADGPSVFPKDQSPALKTSAEKPGIVHSTVTDVPEPKGAHLANAHVREGDAIVRKTADPSVTVAPRPESVTRSYAAVDVVDGALVAQKQFGQRTGSDQDVTMVQRGKLDPSPNALTREDYAPGPAPLGKRQTPLEGQPPIMPDAGTPMQKTVPLQKTDQTDGIAASTHGRIEVGPRQRLDAPSQINLSDGPKPMILASPGTAPTSVAPVSNMRETMASLVTAAQESRDTRLPGSFAQRSENDAGPPRYYAANIMAPATPKMAPGGFVPEDPPSPGRVTSPLLADIIDDVIDGAPHGIGSAQDSRSIGSAPGPSPTMPSSRPDAAPVLRQIAEQMGRLADGGVDIRLSPEELGNVRMQLVQGETGMTVHITADRPETLDLMRRHIDQLARDLADAGYRGTEFSFGEGGERDGQQQSRSDRDRTSQVDQPKTQTSPLTPASEGLDLRM